MIGPVDYASKKTPFGYRCGSCHGSRCKLWRDVRMLATDVELKCGRCVCWGVYGYEKFINDDGKIRDKEHGLTDQIGGWLPAVPTEDGNTFWGYTSVPKAAVAWWRRLPIQAYHHDTYCGAPFDHEGFCESDRIR